MTAYWIIYERLITHGDRIKFITKPSANLSRNENIKTIESEANIKFDITIAKNISVDVCERLKD